MPAVEYSKSFITSVVVGKDVVPRIGLHQLEALRADLINAIKRSVDPKVSGKWSLCAMYASVTALFLSLNDTFSRNKIKLSFTQSLLTI